MESIVLRDTLSTSIQVECLVAFAHSRIVGMSSEGIDHEKVFKLAFANKYLFNQGMKIAEAISSLSTLETINWKIRHGNHRAVKNMYRYHYVKAIELGKLYIKESDKLIEGLIGIHILKLLTKHSYLNSSDSEQLEFLNEVISRYENKQLLKDESTLEVVKNMQKIAEDIFYNYWKRRTNGKRKKA